MRNPTDSDDLKEKYKLDPKHTIDRVYSTTPKTSTEPTSREHSTRPRMTSNMVAKYLRARYPQSDPYFKRFILALSSLARARQAIFFPSLRHRWAKNRFYTAYKLLGESLRKDGHEFNETPDFSEIGIGIIFYFQAYPNWTDAEAIWTELQSPEDRAKSQIIASIITDHTTHNIQP